jgi:acetolactate synthase-1/2/3 large subunit
MNNQHLGLVKQQQELFFNGNYITSKFDSRLDFTAIGRQFGVRGIALNDTIDPVKTIEVTLKKKTMHQML